MHEQRCREAGQELATMPRFINFFALIRTFALMTITWGEGITERNRSCPKTLG
jgi:hypothetical protein